MDYRIIAEGAFPRDKIIVDYQPARVFHLPERFRQEADKLWQAKLAEAKQNNFTLYDGNIFSLLNLSIDTLSDSLIIALGQAGYKDYVVTRTHGFKKSDGAPIVADPLAICCAVITSDNRILIGRRQGVDGSLNKYHIVGGFIDRDLDIYNGLPCPVRAIRREVKEETGIELELDKIICLGAIYDNVTPHPELCFCATTELPFSEIKKLKITEQEVESWEFVQNNSKDLAALLNEYKNELTSVARADLAFYGRFKFGEDWPG